ncbi:hypothetical protein VHUM_02753 [Vanrija humicola]|uniref:DUS-like FMN-binding domain-containing protein n=1 Tax=Vanrija humicola TaxID=5417 RepID=A0A7D8Z7I4_VANHU|nr:hypothetical protein VHUM_02753 [Vanrija humicola]
MALPIEIPRTYPYELNYRDKLVLAPMVRTGTLPTRLLSLYYGAGLVWSPEIVDKAIIGATRTVDPETGVITYSKGQGPIFTTHPIEKPFLIFQIGSANPELAVEAAKVVEQDVAGVDLNCGCPKPFSTHSGMGAGLLSTPDLLLDILRALLRNINLPVSAKIRMLPEQEPTLLLAAKILRTGVSNLTVHCRTRSMRPNTVAMWDRLGDIVELGKRRNLPVICNGDGEGWANWDKIRSTTGATSVMLARSAEKNPSVFQPSGPECTVKVVIPQLLNIAEYTDNPWGNTKFLLMQFKPSPAPVSTLSKQEKKDASEVMSRAKSAQDVVDKYGFAMGQGKAFMDELEVRLKARPEWNVWAARKAAEDEGVVVEAAAAEEASNGSTSDELDDEEAAANAHPA